jgi:hypothetical protein
MIAVATALTSVTSKQNVATQGHNRSKILSLLFFGTVLTENSFLNGDMLRERSENSTGAMVPLSAAGLLPPVKRLYTVEPV